MPLIWPRRSILVIGLASVSSHKRKVFVIVGEFRCFLQAVVLLRYIDDVGFEQMLFSFTSYQQPCDCAV